jgi:hypothetical protein
MRLALELSLNPNAEWYTEMLDVLAEGRPESVTSAMGRQTDAAVAAAEFLTRVLHTPLRTFAGEVETAANEELRKAEAAMELGRHYDGVRHYDRACLLDPANPLPRIGKGHALLASGEYVSAAVSLINGLERFPEMIRFDLDLTALMGGGEIVDIRRADIMKQLARNEDAQLRFLLGYIEMHTGMPEFGMQNLERAARNARPGTLISRYPSMIRAKGIAPLSTPATNEIQDSTPSESSLPGSEPPPTEKDPE